MIIEADKTETLMSEGNLPRQDTNIQVNYVLIGAILVNITCKQREYN